jgi:hypothetical protein
MLPVIGARRTDAVIERVNAIEVAISSRVGEPLGG